MKPRTISVPAENGTRWSSANWLNTDLAQITNIAGPLPVNHMTDKVPAHQAFARWLDGTVKPETFDFIMSNENAFATSYSAYRHLAAFQAKTKNKPNRESTGSAESTMDV